MNSTASAFPHALPGSPPRPRPALGRPCQGADSLHAGSPHAEPKGPRYMSRSKYLGLLALFLTGLFTSRARANEPDRPQPYVVIVGIDRYEDPQILPRKHAEADAR